MIEQTLSKRLSCAIFTVSWSRTKNSTFQLRAGEAKHYTFCMEVPFSRIQTKEALFVGFEFAYCILLLILILFLCPKTLRIDAAPREVYVITPKTKRT